MMPELEKDTIQETAADAQAAAPTETDQTPQEQGGGLLAKAVPSDELDLPPRRARFENRTARFIAFISQDLCSHSSTCSVRCF